MTSRSEKDRKPPLHRVPTYWERTQWPLQSLYFLLPLLIAYEIGTVLYTPSGAQPLPRILAESLVWRFFEWFGVTGVYLPPLLVIVVLLAWHIQSRQPWRPEPRLLGGMLIESVLLTVPLLVLTFVVSREVAAAQAAQPLAAGVPTEWKAQMVLSIGAGIYEELVFRLIAIALLHFILVDALGLPPLAGGWIAVTLAAVAFALYHPFDTYNPRHWPSSDWSRFIFYTLAGFYFAGVYVLRGFGIVVGVHALYDVVVFSLRHIESS